MVYCAFTVRVALFFPVTVMVTFEVPAGVVYFTPVTAELHPEKVMETPARRQIKAR